MVGRACLRHCPVCGSGHLFRRWFSMVERCPRCALRFERIEGHWTGDLGINTIVVAAVTPLAFFPFSKTLWLVIDLTMRPLESGEVRPGFGPPPPRGPAR
jgi:uncharacterized protein (DUF983 family)